MSDWQGWREWYQTIETATLRQGDIIDDLVVFWFPQDLVANEWQPRQSRIAIEAEWDRGTWIVMSASCDVADRKGKEERQVLVGRVLPATKENLKQSSDSELETVLEVLRRGHLPSGFLLPGHPEMTPPFALSVVQWRIQLTLPITYVKRAAADRRRLRLKAPFRESFAHWVSGNIQRVGIEDDVAFPRFRDKFSPEQILKVDDQDLLQ